MRYRYIGGGMGVPGLPHEISDEDAEEMGVVDLLNVAIENQSYAVVSHLEWKSDQSTVTSDQSTVVNDKKKKEVKHGQ